MAHEILVKPADVPPGGREKMRIAAQGVKQGNGCKVTVASTTPKASDDLMVAEVKMKVVGHKPVRLSPEESLRQAMILIRQAEKPGPYPHPRGFVHKAKTYEDYTR